MEQLEDMWAQGGVEFLFVLGLTLIVSGFFVERPLGWVSIGIGGILFLLARLQYPIEQRNRGEPWDRLREQRERDKKAEADRDWEEAHGRTYEGSQEP